MKYVESLVASKEDTAKALAPARTAEQKAKLGLEITTREVDVQTLANKVEELKRAYPLNIQAVAEALDDLDWAKRGIQQLKSVSAELFD